MPHQGTGFTKAKSHSGAALGDTYLNYETALLECASGSQTAVGKIYAREKDQLRGVAHRIVHDRSCAEDVIHDAFVQILRDAKNFDPARGSARGWIYAIVRNTALKMHENARRELALEDDTLNAICEREQTVPNPASCIPDSMTLRTISSSQSAARACFWRSSTGARTRRSPNTSVFRWEPSRRGSGENSWPCAGSSNEAQIYFSPLHPSACVGDSKGDGVVIRTRHVPATVANPKRGAKPCLS